MGKSILLTRRSSSSLFLRFVNNNERVERELPRHDCSISYYLIIQNASHNLFDEYTIF